jgi:hypothetical protein
MTRSLKPFADDAASIGFGGLTVENGTDSITIYGQIDLTRDRTGLDQARALGRLLDEIVKVLENDTNLPERLAPPEEPDEAANPFT